MLVIGKTEKQYQYRFAATKNVDSKLRKILNTSINVKEFKKHNPMERVITKDDIRKQERIDSYFLIQHCPKHTQELKINT